MAETIRLPNIRTRIGGIRGAKDRLDPQRHTAQKEIANQTAEAFVATQDALDILTGTVNGILSVTSTISSSPTVEKDPISYAW